MFVNLPCSGARGEVSCCAYHYSLLLLRMLQRLEADYRSHEEMKASLMEQQRQLNACLLLHRRRRRRRHQQQQHSDDNDDDTAAAFAGVVVVKETGTCRGHVTSFVDDIEETASNSDSGASSLVMSTSSDNGLVSFSVIYAVIVVCL